MGASQQPSQQQNSVLQQLLPELQQLIAAWPQMQGELQQLITGGEANLGKYQGQEAGVGQRLENFNALSPAQIAQLSSTAGAAVQSAGRTFAAETGGVPNQALVEQQLARDASQATGQEATQLGSIAAQQKLSALQSAGGIFGNLAGQSLDSILGGLGIGAGALNTGISGALGVGSQYGQQQSNANQAKGQEWQGIGSLLGGAGTAAGALSGAGAASTAQNPNTGLTTPGGNPYGVQYGQPPLGTAGSYTADDPFATAPAGGYPTPTTVQYS